ncbi:TPA: hypothetical protein IZ355_001887 [Enterococcus faecium]|uniref:hypothetical protein n=1 Tax=Enterococcus faecium TaxID=1352 RepID=UPI0022DEB477|nr:hypothetical protein [Enterococcus faecium]HAR1304500.1 hypothetical protein [Enterococcus faecium]HAR1485270.1 hypothetical protein [Enterococcus faecium]HAR1488058.1 hypothetical protein [Enterococcus faecium]HAR1490770.1 hypothetical protein [Enterococcus faecium]HAR1493507.1 hypothetical protein [Enterococcus faecium]
MSVKDVAKKQILKMEHIIDQISEAEDLLISLKSPALNNLNELMNDVEIRVPTQFLGRDFLFREEERNKWHGVRLEGDLGIVDVQEEIRKLVAKSVQKRIETLESELRAIIYYRGDHDE